MIITRTPFRITLGGGGTDLPSYYSKYGGFVLSAGIDKYMYIGLNTPLLDDLIRVRYSQNEFCTHPDEIHHSLVREALKAVDIQRRVEIVSIADIPAGTGLGSSSSYLVGLLNALYTLLGTPVPRAALANEACRIELDVLSKPIGKQDQFMAAFGGLTTLQIDRDGKVKAERLDIELDVLEALENNILLFYTGVQRDAMDILRHQHQETKKDNQAVVESLHEIKELGLEICEALRGGHLRRVGELFDVHWQAKKRLSTGITNPQIDAWYELAKQNGAIGGKVSGAGGGGFLLLYCENDKSRLRAALAPLGLVELPFRFDLEGTKVLVDWLSRDKSWEQIRRRKSVDASAAPNRGVAAGAQTQQL